MATPYGHSLAGVLIYLGVHKGKLKDNRTTAGLYILSANLPDLDFIPGIIIGNPDRFHHGISHSIGLALLFAGIVGGYGWFKNKRNKVRHFLVCFCLYFSHIFIDWFTSDSGFPYGVLFWWPFSNQYYIAPLTILPEVWRHDLLSVSTIVHDIKAMLIETALFLPLILIFQYFRKRIEQRNRKLC